MNVLTLVVLIGIAVLGAVLVFVLLARYRRLQRQAREEAAAAAAAVAAAAAAAADQRDEEVTYPIAVHLEAARLAGRREAIEPAVWLPRSDPRTLARRRRRQPHHDMGQPGTPAQRLNKDRGYDPWQPLQDLEVGDDVV